jgi:hypothetical protein
MGAARLQIGRNKASKNVDVVVEDFGMTQDLAILASPPSISPTVVAMEITTETVVGTGKWPRPMVLAVMVAVHPPGLQKRSNVNRTMIVCWERRESVPYTNGV